MHRPIIFYWMMEGGDERLRESARFLFTRSRLRVPGLFFLILFLILFFLFVLRFLLFELNGLRLVFGSETNPIGGAETGPRGIEFRIVARLLPTLAPRLHGGGCKRIGKSPSIVQLRFFG